MITRNFLSINDLMQTMGKTIQTPKAPVPIGHLSLKALRSAGLNPLPHSPWFLWQNRSISPARCLVHRRRYRR